MSLLSEHTKDWIEGQRWAGLRPIQKKAIPVVHDLLNGQSTRDCVVSAPTATGKTEAVFLPIASVLEGETAEVSAGEDNDASGGAAVLYICPLTALIDQQAQRLEDLFDKQRTPIVPWHGTSGRTGKTRFKENPRGIVVITPESLESQFINQSERVPSYYRNLRCIVIDELHAFFDSPRGYQLMSQLNRLEAVAGGRRIPRIALSATFSQQHEDAVKEQLRPEDPGNVDFVPDDESRQVLKFHTHSFVPSSTDTSLESARDRQLCEQILADFGDLGTVEGTADRRKGLIFVNSRQLAERFSQKLTELAEGQGKKCTFYPHHGSLAAERRRAAEAAIRSTDEPAVIVATSTLELGIDIGAIAKVGQLDPGSSVASLQQRLGRSGRKHGEVSDLIIYVREGADQSVDDTLSSLRLPTVQALAQVSLVKEQAYENPDIRSAHLSTLLQQVLSVANYMGTVSKEELRDLLVERGPFRALRQVRDAEGRVRDPDGHFDLFMARLVWAGLLEPREPDVYAAAPRGARLMGHHSFYAAFSTGNEFTVQGPTGTLGRMPVGNSCSVGDRIVFGGELWRILAITTHDRTIRVVPAAAGEAPVFPGDPIPPSETVVRRMREILAGRLEPERAEMSDACADLLAQGRASFAAMGLERRFIVTRPKGVVIFPWAGQRRQLSMLYALRYWGLNAVPAGVAIFVEPATEDEVRAALGKIAGREPVPLPHPSDPEAVRNARSLLLDKHDRHLSPYLQRWNLATARVDMAGTPELANELLGPRPRPKRAASKKRPGR